MADRGDGRAKALFVLANFAGGGAERVGLLLLQHLDRESFAPHLAVLDASGPLRSLVSDDTLLHDLRQPRLSRALPGLLRLIRREKPAVVFATQGYINIALLALRPLLPAGTRLALRESNTPSQSLPNRRAPQLMRWAYRRFYPRADVVFCQHRQTESELQRDFAVPASLIETLPNPVNVARLREAAATPHRSGGPGLRFVSAGRLHRQKGFDRLLTLFADLPPDSQLIIHGEGSEEAALRAQIAALGLQDRVTLAGFTGALPAVLAGADSCVLASRWEGLPNVALEALAVGTPVIATPDCGGISELAEAAAPGAVTVAAWGDDFRAALRTCPRRDPQGTAPSLLPPRYDVAAVATTFNAALRRLTSPRDLG